MSKLQKNALQKFLEARFSFNRLMTFALNLAIFWQTERRKHVLEFFKFIYQ